MGLGNNSGNKKFITIVGGKWTLRVPEGTSGATERTLEKGPRQGSSVYELYFDYIDGMITSGGIKTGQYGSDLCLDMYDEGEIYTVQIPMDSQFFSQFAKTTPNIDVTKKIFIGIGTDKEKNKDFIYVKQEGSTVHSAFTKDNPNGMPAPILKNVKGTEKLDFEDQEQFLYDKVIDFLAQLDNEPAKNIVERTFCSTNNKVDGDEIPF